MHRRVLLGPRHTSQLRFSPPRNPGETGPPGQRAEEARLTATRKRIPTILYNEPSPLEVKVLTRRFGLPNSASIDTYLASDGYKGYEKSRSMKPEEIIEEVKSSALRRRGVAGFPTGMKWSFVPRTSPKPNYI